MNELALIRINHPAERLGNPCHEANLPCKGAACCALRRRTIGRRQAYGRQEVRPYHAFPRRSRGRGFTLIEVLVSLAIFALSAVVLSVAYLNVLGSYRALGSHQSAEENWKLVRAVVLTEAEREKVEAGGRLALPDGRQLNWTAGIESTEVADLFRLTLEAEAAASGGTEAWRHKQVIHVLRPAWSDPGEREQLREKTRQRLAQERGP
ncbi:MAG: prepilin-type N-terminal cleavage/methylation domain-containing protein [Verrucomicrobiota bacterium]